ncbi:hypothetical protein Kisp01_39060 [Kineosporia sp. NBRC 101677]|uniref:hypothetical protein n=1 Tax=Kineosporia sp. NBRC 101677 TaxID=3032197 RepID=UPI0024A0CDB7|nr:hypothetical protein [Kineosporia sp. NBRC 101677]GLY16891.1 hypothetical protein Kisp01_39060 [Kineosporia sp. NBRC 101677]
MKNILGIRRLALSALAIVLAATALMAFGTTSAQAAQSDCDEHTVAGQFRRVDSGASFTYAGRVVELQNERLFDRFSRAEIKSGRQSGDRVWVDRSFRSFPNFKGIKSDAEAKRDGWKMCGSWPNRTDSVYNSNYAARACAEMSGVTKCGKWWVD